MKLTTFDALSIAVITAAWDPGLEFVCTLRAGVPRSAMVSGFDTLYYLSAKCWMEFITSHPKELPFVESLELRPYADGYDTRKPYPCTWCGGACADVPTARKILGND